MYILKFIKRVVYTIYTYIIIILKFIKRVIYIIYIYIIIILPVSIIIVTTLPFTFFFSFIFLFMSIFNSYYRKRYNVYTTIPYQQPQTMYIYFINIIFYLPYNLSFTVIYRSIFFINNIKSKNFNQKILKILPQFLLFFLYRYAIIMFLNVPGVLHA